jgi:hypothetical protein
VSLAKKSLLAAAVLLGVLVLLGVAFPRRHHWKPLPRIPAASPRAYNGPCYAWMRPRRYYKQCRP